MKFTFPIVTLIAFLLFTLTAHAQRPGGGRRGAGGGFGRQGGPPAGINQDNANLQNQAFGNRFGNQNAANQSFGNQNAADQNRANQKMPTIEQLAQMMIANFDADGSGGLEQAELQNGLTALRQMMQNQNGMNQGHAGDAANEQNAFGQNSLRQNNQAADGNAAGRPPRGPRGGGGGGGGANNFRAAGRGR